MPKWVRCICFHYQATIIEKCPILEFLPLNHFLELDKYRFVPVCGRSLAPM